jgi:excisionase family DNA binding protein
MTTTNEKLLLSRTEAAEALGICPTTIWKLVKRGELHPIYIGDRPLFPRLELERFVTEATA